MLGLEDGEEREGEPELLMLYFRYGLTDLSGGYWNWLGN